MTEQPTEQLEDQVERTQLAWRRTALSLVAAGLLVGHLSGQRAGRWALAVSLVGIAACVGFVWVRRGTRVGGAGFAMVIGVLLLGGVALAGVVAGK